ncbi:amidohydrolase [Nocardioides sp. MAH-18]|uniref:Amidohydrolase n=1 Tax=Nocardioides agri TaxID=2682843 RepID=A0A6L6XN63_9ACTN|nr:MULTISPECIES: M20 family metallopeptidase [unclassified Nocardioides]MBA2953799.1 amidohydrolase [Nocardioides sp. CGMCC 1.13656]MVQ48664.1 amidohydrolase [Nocardioides sp. MAH-18]
MSELHRLVDEACAEHEEWLIASRAWLHAHPELSNREEQTAAYVAAQLRELGLDEVRTGISGHGVVGVLRGGLPGERVIALRADMDALPVEGADGVGPVSHACGHDCHVATVLTTARVLAGVRDKLPGTVVFFFQPAEEGAPIGEIAGAKAMLDAGALDGVEPTMVFAMHVVYLPKGVIGYHVGNQFAAACAVDVTIRGVQTHGAAPWLGVDPMPAAAQVILGASQLYRQVPAASPVAVSIGHVEDVGRCNIIGASVTLSGTMRSSRQEDMPALKAGFERLAEHSAAAYGCTAELDYHFEIPAVRNEQAWFDAARPTLERAVGAERVVPVEPVMGSDDMAELVSAYGGLYLTYGVQDTRMDGDRVLPVEGGRGLAPNHHPAFYADDASLLDNVRVHAHVAVDHLLGDLDARVPR